MSISANGYIADQNGSEDFLSHQNWIEFSDLCNKVGCLFWGRKTYQEVITWPAEYLEALEKVTKIIISSDPDFKVNPGFETAISTQEALEKAAGLGFKQVILTGGSTLNSAFAKENLIDEVILDVEPTILGKGLPLFAPENFEIKFKLEDIRELPEGIVQVHYTKI